MRSEMVRMMTHGRRRRVEVDGHREGIFACEPGFKRCEEFWSVKGYKKTHFLQLALPGNSLIFLPLVWHLET